VKLRGGRKIGVEKKMPPIFLLKPDYLTDLRI
jgi:hypothetical protein